MKLYEMTKQFNELFDQFDEIDNYIPETDEFGRYIDGNGDIIEAVEVNPMTSVYLTSSSRCPPAKCITL